MQELQGIPGYSDWRFIQPISKGWSADRKFYIETVGGIKLLLRLAAGALSERKQLEYELVGRASQLGIPMPQPVDFGRCKGGQYVYTLLTWVPGQEAELVVPSLSEERQYDLGVVAGQILQQLHSISAPADQPNWYERASKKAADKLRQYRACGMQLPDAERYVAYIVDNLVSLKNRPNTFQHGDFHLGNMIIQPNGDLAIIDFNRLDYGDPWEEFNRLAMFTCHLSPSFARGQLHGYFAGQPPEEFFRVMAWYAANDCVGGVAWSLAFGEAELKGHLHRSRLVYDDYAGFTTPVPHWYRDESV